MYSMNKLFLIFPVLILTSCGSGGSEQQSAKSSVPISKKYEVKLITVDPGHFHAALVQKIMYDQVSPEVHVYAPEGPDYLLHLERIKSYNARTVNPTSWDEKYIQGPISLKR